MSCIIEETSTKIRILTYGGHFTENPSFNTRANKMRIFTFSTEDLTEDGMLVQEETVTFLCPEHVLKVGISIFSTF